MSTTASRSAAAPARPARTSGYQQAWHFSDPVLTVVFSVFALALLLSLLTTGSLSEHLGRRPVIAASLAVLAVAMLIQLLAHGVPELLIARVLQGLATGTVTSALSALLLDLDDSRRPGRAALANAVAPVIGMAAGVLIAALTAAYVPDPTRTIPLLFLALFALQAAATAVVIPETAHPHRGALAAMRPRLAVPPTARHALAISAPPVVAVWALGGLYSSLGPRLPSLIAPHSGALTGNLVFLAFTTSAACTVAACHGRPARTVMLWACSLLIAGVALTTPILQLPSLAGVFAGTCLAGAGFGAIMQGALSLLLSGADAGERAGIVATYYTIGYFSLSVPTIGAGFLAAHSGLLTTTRVYGLFVIALAALALIGLTRRAGHS
ncbi:MFS transporter [Streptomyces sparsogenes]|uniref:MFS transporter n=1 Tax=Streptomyces sparsogenes TaxID=67365 RepID=UPI0033C55715